MSDPKKRKKKKNNSSEPKKPGLLRRIGGWALKKVLFDEEGERGTDNRRNVFKKKKV